MNKKRAISLAISLIVLAVLIALDQYSKVLVNQNIALGEEIPILSPVLFFTHAENNGAAWSILSGKQIFFIVLTFVMILVFGFVYFRMPLKKRFTPLRYTLVVLTAGAIGNLIDRIRIGTVTDFIHTRLVYYWIFKKEFPIYNIADICVTLSMAVLILLIIFYYKDKDFAFLKRKKGGTETGDGATAEAETDKDTSKMFYGAEVYVLKKNEDGTVTKEPFSSGESH